MTTGVHEDDNAEGSGRRRFEQSYSRYMAQLRAQRQVNQLFQIKREREDPGDFEMETPIRLVYDEERPSFKDIEAYRGDKESEITESDRALQQSLSYMEKYVAYFKNIQKIGDIKQIPSKSERLLMLQNFEKYLEDARYYIKFYQKYSHYWAPQATRTIVEYKGLYVPLEKRKEEETYHFGEDINRFQPLRKMIYQDFHNKVRKGQDPSLDLDGRLPTLAMYYARTTFVPPMTSEEMHALFYPDKLYQSWDKIAALKSKEWKLGSDLKSSDISFYSDLNPFQLIYLTRFHYLKHMNLPLCSSFSLSKGSYNTLTGNMFFDQINRLLYLFREIAQPGSQESILLLHSTQNETLQQCTTDYILLICYSIIAGIPFITVDVDSDMKVEDILETVSQYSTCSLLCTFDEFIASTLSQATSSSICKLLGLKHLLYYGSLEPRAVVTSVKGSASTEDPVSRVLQPTKEIPQELSYKTLSLFEYLPSSKDNHFETHQIKQLLSSTKGVSFETIERCRIEALKRSAKSRSSMTPLDHPIYQVLTPGKPLKVLTVRSIVDASDRVAQRMSNLLETLQSSPFRPGSKGQVLIGLSCGHPLFHFWILFCFKYGLSFTVLSPAELANEQVAIGHLQDIRPAIVIADQHNVLNVLRLMNSRNSTSKKHSTLDNDSITTMNLKYQGLLAGEGSDKPSTSSWFKSSLLKSVESKLSESSQRTDSAEMIGFISVGYNTIPESASLLQNVPHAYHVTFSKSLYSPITVEDLKTRVVTHVPDSVEINDQTREITVHGSVPADMIPQAERRLSELAHFEGLEQQLSELLRSEDGDSLTRIRSLMNRMTMPADCSHSFSKLLELKRENTFYRRVKSALEKRQQAPSDQTSVSDVENALFLALLDELETVVGKDYWVEVDNTTVPDIPLVDLLKLISMRIELTSESTKLQVMDFNSKFSAAKRDGKLTIVLNRSDQVPQFIARTECTLTDVKSFGLHKLITPHSDLIHLSNGGIINCYLLQYLFEMESNGLITRCFISKHVRTENQLQLLLLVPSQQCKYAITMKWTEICLRVKLKYESLLNIRVKPSIWSKMMRKHGMTIYTISADNKITSFHLPDSTSGIQFVTDRSLLQTMFRVDGEWEDKRIEKMFSLVFEQGTRQLNSRL